MISVAPAVSHFFCRSLQPLLKLITIGRNSHLRLTNFARLGLLLFLAALACAHLAAQDVSGSLRVTVLDPSGATVAGAKVTAINIETGLMRTTSSDAKGDYLLVALPVGSYRLEVEAKGFRTYAQEGITLNVNQPATVPVHLAVGAAAEKLEVKANADSLKLPLQAWVHCRRSRSSRSPAQWSPLHAIRLAPAWRRSYYCRACPSGRHPCAKARLMRSMASVPSRTILSLMARITLMVSMAVSFLSLRRCHRRIPHPYPYCQRRIWPQHGLHHQHRYPLWHQSVSWRSMGILP